MRARVWSFTVIAVCLTLGATACGGGDAESRDASAALLGQIDGICDDWRETVDERGPFPVESFDPEDRSPGDLPTVGDYFAAGHPAAEQTIAELRHLSPPSSLAADVETLVSAVERQLENGETQASAARIGDVAAFTATLDEAMSSQADLKEAADELGTPGCAF
jgi:hypothetical protein